MSQFSKAVLISLIKYIFTIAKDVKTAEIKTFFNHLVGFFITGPKKRLILAILFIIFF